MAYTTEQIDALKAALATGALEVESASGERIRYRSRDDMLAQLATMEAEVAPSSRAMRVRFVNPKLNMG